MMNTRSDSRSFAASPRRTHRRLTSVLAGRSVTSALTLLAVALAAVLALSLPLQPKAANAFPEPLIVSGAWEFEFKHGALKPIAVRNVEGEFVWYWYMPYSVENKTGRERIFAPEFEIATDQGQIFRGNRRIPPTVFLEVKKRLGNDLLESPIGVTGRFLQGPDNVKESVVIWKANPNVSRFTVFVAGISGETQRLTLGRSLQVVDKNKGEVTYNGPLITEVHRRGVPRGVGRKLNYVDKYADDLRAIKSFPYTEETATGSVTVDDLGKAWNISYSDADHTLVVTHKKTGLDKVLRKQMMIEFRLPSRPATPQNQKPLLVGREWVIR